MTGLQDLTIFCIEQNRAVYTSAMLNMTSVLVTAPSNIESVDYMLSANHSVDYIANVILTSMKKENTNTPDLNVVPFKQLVDESTED